MKLTNWYNGLTDNQKHYFRMFIYTLVVALLSAGLTYHFTAKHWQSKYDTLNNKYETYVANNPAVSNTTETEQAIIDKALNDKANNVPVRETLGTNTTSIISYVPKTSKNDADLEINSDPTQISISYNGKKEALPTTNYTENGVTSDGKFVYNQKQSATIDIDSIVNREIANTIQEEKHKQAVLERQKKQNAFWGVVGGLAVGYIAGHH